MHLKNQFNSTSPNSNEQNTQLWESQSLFLVAEICTYPGLITGIVVCDSGLGSPVTKSIGDRCKILFSDWILFWRILDWLNWVTSWLDLSQRSCHPSAGTVVFTPEEKTAGAALENCMVVTVHNEILAAKLFVVRFFTGVGKRTQGSSGESAGICGWWHPRFF